MNNYIAISIPAVSFSGYSTYEVKEVLPRHEALRKLADKKILRRFQNPFNFSIEVVIIDEA